MSTPTAPRTTFWRIPPAGIWISLIVVCLTCIGLVALFSASQAMQDDATYMLRKQITWLGIALLVGTVTFTVDLEWARSYVWLLAALGLLLLALVLVPGIGMRVNGAQRWINFGFINLQVSEVGKIALLFALAHYLAANRRRMDEFLRGFIVPCMILGSFCLLIFFEPDFGTAVLCGAVGGTLLFLAGVKLRYLFPVAGLAAVLFSVAVYLDPIRLKRITSFLDVEGNRTDSSYQLWQGMLAFGAGGIGGVGIGEGRQQMSFLPEAHTDFIFAIVGEEMGLLSTAGVVILFMTLFFIGVLQLKRAPNLYQYLLIMGALLFVTFQAMINIGVVTGCLPTKGMSLPFISYGGSNLVLMFALCGIILNGFRSWELPALRRPRDL